MREDFSISCIARESLTLSGFLRGIVIIRLYELARWLLNKRNVEKLFLDMTEIRRHSRNCVKRQIPVNLLDLKVMLLRVQQHGKEWPPHTQYMYFS